MTLIFDYDAETSPIMLRGIFEDELEAFQKKLTDAQNKALIFSGFKAQTDQVHIILNSEGDVEIALFGKGDEHKWREENIGTLARKLPPALYALAGSYSPMAYLAWGLGSYQFNKYKKEPKPSASLLVVEKAIEERLMPILNGAALTKNLINTPANDLGPYELETAALELARKYDAKFRNIVGKNLLKDNFPLIHTVGRAATEERQPRLCEFTWEGGSNMHLTLVGKGIVFDTGGLNLKPGASMDLMKKDMGGAAHALGLASMIMEAGLPITLRVILSIAENCVSGDSFRPSDVYPSRSGKTVEIGNTDAEGRLVLADALTYACEKPTDFIVDFATLTGAARVAVGTDIAPFYTNSPEWAKAVTDHSFDICDPVWQMPLYDGYRKLLKSRIADINHISQGPFGGSITAALFLEEFVDEKIDWMHFDIYSWTNKVKPMAVEGGEVQGIRALFETLKHKVGND